MPADSVRSRTPGIAEKAALIDRFARVKQCPTPTRAGEARGSRELLAAPTAATATQGNQPQKSFAELGSVATIR